MIKRIRISDSFKPEQHPALQAEVFKEIHKVYPVHWPLSVQILEDGGVYYLEFNTEDPQVLALVDTLPCGTPSKLAPAVDPRKDPLDVLKRALDHYDRTGDDSIRLDPTSAQLLFKELTAHRAAKRRLEQDMLEWRE